MGTNAKGWTTFIRLGHCSGAENRRNAVRHVGYLLRPNECMWAVSNEGPVDNAQDAQERWKEIINAELAVRVDARLQSRLVIPLPNGIDLEAFKREMGSYFGRLALRNQRFMLTIHRGKAGRVEENLHAHLVYNDRDLATGKKDRNLMKKEWLQGVKSQYERFLGSQGYSLQPTAPGAGRERLSRPAFESKNNLPVRRAEMRSLGRDLDTLEIETIATINIMKRANAPRPTVHKGCGIDWDAMRKEELRLAGIRVAEERKRRNEATAKALKELDERVQREALEDKQLLSDPLLPDRIKRRLETNTDKGGPKPWNTKTYNGPKGPGV